MGESADYARFIRNFSTRLVQTVVQARIGRLISTPCTSNPDWFSTNIDELGEVAAYIKQCLQRFPPDIDAFTLEFILFTASGHHLPLESWVVSVDADACDSRITMSHLYHQLGVLLRGATVAARMTPLYRYYVKKQGEDSFIVLYRIIEGDVISDNALEYTHRQLGRLPSPFGTLQLDLFFKEKVEIVHSPVPHVDKIDRPTCYSSAVRVEGTERIEATSPIDAEQHTFTAGSPQDNVSVKTKSVSVTSSSSSSSEDEDQMSVPCRCRETSGCSLPELEETSSDGTSRRRHNSFPFAVLLSSSHCKCGSHDIHAPPKEPVISESRIEEREDAKEESEAMESSNSSEDEIDSSAVIGDVPKLFSTSSYPANAIPGADLAEFLEQCRHAPRERLESASEDNPAELVNQLHDFEKNMKLFDDFVKEIDEQVEKDE